MPNSPALQKRIDILTQAVAQGKQLKPEHQKEYDSYVKMGAAKSVGGDAEKPYSQSALDAFDRAIATAGRLKKHVGLEAGVGMPAINANPLNLFGAMEGNIAGHIVPGSNAADFRTELETMKSQVFLPMVQSMKGMGALSNAEGEKLTAAIGNLDPHQSEAQFQQSLDRIVGDLQYYRDRSGGGKPAPAARQGKSGDSDVDEILRRHGVIK